LEFKIQDIDLLSEVREKYLDGIELFLNIEDITDHFVSKIGEITHKNPGKGSLLFNITDTQDDLKVDMFSRKVRVGVSNDMVEEIEALPGIRYRILIH
jgi:DNA polymerase-3 subunit alpha